MIYKEIRDIKKMLEELTEKSILNIIKEEIDDEEWQEIEYIDKETDRVCKIQRCY